MDSISEIIDQLRHEAEEDYPASLTPDVGIIMGSDSDLDIMKGAHEALTRLGFAEQTAYPEEVDERFSFETYVVSAHRTPELMYAYGETADARGIEVIIAGAGGKSADLPNMTASIAFPLPVIGVPVQEKSVDSVIGMPTGAPIVAVDAGKSFNAGLSAAQILSRAHPELKDELVGYHDELRQEVGEISARLYKEGVTEFQR